MISMRAGLGGLLLAMLAGSWTSAQVLWKEPRPTTTADWTWGVGGEQMAPLPPLHFLKEKLTGSNPKVEVRDDAGRVWIVKFGAEVHADTFASRLVNAMGYASEPTYFVPAGSILEAQHLKRAKYYIAKNGSFRNARFKLQKSGSKSPDGERTWSWVSNPFLGSRELSGLKILTILASNWDTKDARDGDSESNNEIIRLASESDSPRWYAVTDWGASFGRTGGYFRRDRWDWNGYRSQNAHFVWLASNGELRWGFKGKHNPDLTAGLGVEDVRWLLLYLSRIRDEDLEAGLAASGASAPVAREYTRLIRQRIVQLQSVAEPSGVQQAAK